MKLSCCSIPSWSLSHPMLHDLAVGHVDHVELRPRRRLAGCRHARELSGLGASGGHAKHHLVVLSDHVVDRVCEVRERRTDRSDERLQARQPCRDARGKGSMLDVVISEHGLGRLLDRGDRPCWPAANMVITTCRGASVTAVHSSGAKSDRVDIGNSLTWNGVGMSEDVGNRGPSWPVSTRGRLDSARTPVEPGPRPTQLPGMDSAPHCCAPCLAREFCGTRAPLFRFTSQVNVSVFPLGGYPWIVYL
jgi:hypothetical protein